MITKDPSGQFLMNKSVALVLAELVSASDLDAVYLPPNSVIVSGQVETTEAFNSTSTDTVDIGDSASQNRYLNDGNIRALAARVPLVPTGFIHPGGYITARWNSGGGSPSTGKARLSIQYYVIGKSQFIQED